MIRKDIPRSIRKDIPRIIRKDIPRSIRKVVLGKTYRVFELLHETLVDSVAEVLNRRRLLRLDLCRVKRPGVRSWGLGARVQGLGLGI